MVQALNDVNVPGTDHYREVPMIAGWSNITIGKTGFVADLMESLKGFGKSDFEKCSARAKKGMFEGVPITVLAFKRPDL